MGFLDSLRNLYRGARAEPETDGPPMIACEEALAVMQEFIDGELEGVSHEQVQMHFDVCKACYPNLRFEEAFRAALQRAAHRETPSDDLRARVLQSLSEADS